MIVGKLEDFFFSWFTDDVTLQKLGEKHESMARERNP